MPMGTAFSCTERENPDKASIHDVRKQAVRSRTAKRHDKRDLMDARAVIRRRPVNGGARRDRTDDLLLAKQALSQLSYGPGDAEAR